MFASRSGTLPLIPALLSVCPSVLAATDAQGNTALHHASCAGELKVIRLLLQFGADPMPLNNCNWSPVHYSATRQAEEYLKNLIVEMEKKKAEGQRQKQERDRMRSAGVRIVTNEEALVRQRARDDAAIAGLPPPSGLEWSPVQQRRAMTPTENRNAGWFGDGNRARAHSGD